MGVAVGLIGAGRIGAFHARVLAASELVDELTITDVDTDRAARLATALGARWAPSPEVLVDAGAQALVIASPTATHADLIHLGARASLPVFCEKPVALDLDATDAVLDHVAAAGTLLQVGFQRRFDAGYRAARRAMESGSLGRLQLIRAATHDPAPPAEPYLAGSGGLWRDLLIHDFDAIAWVTGQPIVEVYADGAASHEMFSAHGDVDAATAVVRMAGGALGILSGARRNPLGYDVRMELLGTRDSIAVGADRRTAMRSVESGAAPSGKGYGDFMERFQAAYRAELQAFLDTVVKGGRSQCSGADARQALSVALAAARSLAERRPVLVAEVTAA